MKKPLIIAAMVIASTAQARWIQFDDDKTNTVKYYYENTNIAVDYNNGLTQIAWIKADNADKTTYVMRIEIHCPGRFNRIVMGKSYNTQGQVIGGTDYNPYIPWEPIIPNTIADNLYKRLCVK